MTGGEKLLVGGIVAVGALWFFRSASSAAPVPPPATAPTAGLPTSAVASRLAYGIGNVGGAVVAGALGAGPAAPVVGAAGGSFLQKETGGFSSGATGVKQIVTGHVTAGIVSIGKGALQTAAAPITSTVGVAKSVLNAIHL